MKRIPVIPRIDYKEKIEALGFDFHGDYWREEAYYSFTIDEIGRLEEATREAYRMYCEAVQHILEYRSGFMEHILNIPEEVCERIRESWDADELSLYGRFDFMLAKDGTPKFWSLTLIRLLHCWKLLSSNGNGKKMYFLITINITAFMKGWYNRGRIFFRKEEISISLEHWRIMKIPVLCNIWRVQQWKPDFLPAYWIWMLLICKMGVFLIRQVNR